MLVNSITDGASGSESEYRSSISYMTGVSESESRSELSESSSRVGEYEVNTTLDASAEMGRVPGRSPAAPEKGVSRSLDKTLLKRAQQILECFDCDEELDAAVNMEAMRGIVLELWRSAEASSAAHQDILAILENAILSIDIPTPEQLSVLREAVSDLGNDTLTEANVEVIRKQFINRGFSPLALLTHLPDDDPPEGSQDTYM